MIYNNKEENVTELTLRIGKDTLKYSSPYTDVDINDLLDAFYGMLVSHTYLPQTVAEAMREIADSKLESLDDYKNPFKEEDKLEED